MISLIHLSLLAMRVLCVTLGQIPLKAGVQGTKILPAFIKHWTMLGLLAYGIDTLLWTYVLSRVPLTTAYPFTALTFALTYLAGAWIFNKPITLRALTGVVLTMGGLFSSSITLTNLQTK